MTDFIKIIPFLSPSLSLQRGILYPRLIVHNFSRNTRTSFLWCCKFGSIAALDIQVLQPGYAHLYVGKEYSVPFR